MLTREGYSLLSCWFEAWPALSLGAGQDVTKKALIRCVIYRLQDGLVMINHEGDMADCCMRKASQPGCARGVRKRSSHTWLCCPEIVVPPVFNEIQRSNHFVLLLWVPNLPDVYNS